MNNRGSHISAAQVQVTGSRVWLPRLDSVASGAPIWNCARAQDSGFYREVLEAVADPLFVFACGDRHQPLLYVNAAFERWSQCLRRDLLGFDWRSIVATASHSEELERLRSDLDSGLEARALLQRRQHDGSSIWYEIQLAPLPADSGERSQYVGTLRDVTAEQIDREQLRQAALIDSLTELANRRLLRERLEQAIAYARTCERTFAVAFLDLDHFKEINDTFGHQVGDALLQQVAERLRDAVRETDTVARLSGDEFVLLLASVGDDETAEMIGQRVSGWLRKPLCVLDTHVKMSCSVGVARFPIDGADASRLLSNADSKMYRNKISNRGHVGGRQQDEPG